MLPIKKCGAMQTVSHGVEENSSTIRAYNIIIRCVCAYWAEEVDSRPILFNRTEIKSKFTHMLLDF